MGKLYVCKLYHKMNKIIIALIKHIQSANNFWDRFFIIIAVIIYKCI